MLETLRKLHHRHVFERRVDVLAHEIVGCLPRDLDVLDVGCGDGTVSRKVMDQRPDLRYAGIDVMARPTCAIPYATFDGTQIPRDDGSVDAVQFVDVLHHSNSPDELMREAVRVSRRYVIIKDHTCKNRLDFATLQFMDWVGNAPHGVKLIYNFKNDAFWSGLWRDLNLNLRHINRCVPLYPFPFNVAFGRDLHFVALLQKT